MRLMLVTVGSSANGFDRLVRTVDELKGEGKINDKVVAQYGNGQYKPRNVEKSFRFASWEKICELNKKAGIIISHAGAGTIIMALQYKKPIICIPRLKRLKEHTDDHQLEITKRLGRENKILVANDKNEVLDCIKKIKNGWKPKAGSERRRVDSIVRNYLDLCAK